jgi:hypothetical protein
MLAGRKDLALLWDIRCRRLMVETQNINVGACRFYERKGCMLRTVRRGAYPQLPQEIQLRWFMDLLR